MNDTCAARTKVPRCPPLKAPRRGTLSEAASAAASAAVAAPSCGTTSDDDDDDDTPHRTDATAAEITHNPSTSPDARAAMELSGISGGRGNRPPHFAARVNQDCVDIIVGYAACDAKAVLTLRGTCWALGDGVAAVFDQLHTAKLSRGGFVLSDIGAFFGEDMTPADVLLTAMYRGVLYLDFARPPLFASSVGATVFLRARVMGTLAHVTTVEVRSEHPALSNAANAAVIEAIAACCPATKHFVFAGSNDCLAPELVVNVARVCPRLETLRISDYPLAPNSLTPELLGIIAANCPELTSLSAPRSFGPTTAAECRAFAQQFPMLTSLDVRGKRTRLETDEDFEEYDQFPPGGLGDQALAAIAAGLPALTCIDLSGCSDATDHGFAGLFADLPGLRTVGLGFTRASQAAFTSLAEHCPALTCIDLSGCSDVVTVARVNALFADLPGLRTVVIQNMRVTKKLKLFEERDATDREKLQLALDDRRAEQAAAWQHHLVREFMGKFVTSSTRLSTLGAHDGIVKELNAFVYTQQYKRAAQLLTPAARGVLLFGLPGTGKTFLARALAGELGAELLVVDAAEVKSKWVGEGERRIKAIFQAVAELARADPAKRFVVFFDELENLARARSSGEQHSQDQTTALLQAYEAFVALPGDLAKRLVLVGATNFPSQVDSAVARRLGQHFEVPLPSGQQREAAFRAKFDKMCAPDAACSIEVAEADAAAQLAVVVERSENFSMSDINQAMDRVLRRLLVELGDAMNAPPPFAGRGDSRPDERGFVLVQHPSPHISVRRATDPVGAGRLLTAAEAGSADAEKLCRRPLWADVAAVVCSMQPSNGPRTIAEYHDDVAAFLGEASESPF